MRVPPRISRSVLTTLAVLALTGCRGDDRAEIARLRAENDALHQEAAARAANEEGEPGESDTEARETSEPVTTGDGWSWANETPEDPERPAPREIRESPPPPPDDPPPARAPVVRSPPAPDPTPARAAWT